MSNFEWIAAAVIAVLSSARITRLIIWDKYPPSAWVRSKWDALTNDGEWSVLVHCGYCTAPYVALFTIGSGYLSDWHLGWWLFNGWLAASYLAAIVVAYDGDDE